MDAVHSSAATLRIYLAHRLENPMKFGRRYENHFGTTNHYKPMGMWIDIYKIENKIELIRDIKYVSGTCKLGIVVREADHPTDTPTGWTNIMDKSGTVGTSHATAQLELALTGKRFVQFGIELDDSGDVDFLMEVITYPKTSA